MRRASRTQLRGVLETVRAGNRAARALAIADSRAMVRSLFLSSALRIGLLDHLQSRPTFSELVELTGSTRVERLQAWLDIGTELGELVVRGGRYQVHGRRARAIVGGDGLLRAHYRSMLDYQVGPYKELESLLRSSAGAGRSDLDEYPDDIAQVSLAATPFLGSYLTALVAESRPARILDIGCGTAIYSTIAAAADPAALIDGIDLAETVIDAARAQLQSQGLDRRVTLFAGDIREWTPPSGDGYDLVLLLNNIYYFPPGERVALYRRLSELLTDGGRLMVASLVAPGSIAAAHLHFMLSCQTGAAALPRPGELNADLAAAGFLVLDTAYIVPTEPFIAITARRSVDNAHTARTAE